MRYIFGLLCVCALGVVPLVGCGDNNSGDEEVACEGNVCPCTEAGIRAAIAEGGGPFTFACVGAQTVVTAAEIVIDNDVVLDGADNLTVEVSELRIGDTGEATLRSLTVKGTVWNFGSLTLEDSAVVGSLLQDGQILDGEASLSLVGSTVSGAVGVGADGIYGLGGTIDLTSSTVSGNQGDGVNFFGAVNVLNSTISGNGRAAIGGCEVSIAHSTIVGDIRTYDAKGCGYRLSVGASLISGECSPGFVLSDIGYNIQSPGASCIEANTGSAGHVLPVDLRLGDLQDNGGPTRTHELLPGSIAFDVIPEADCVDADGAPLTTDQRGVARPQGDSCDVGAFEVEVAP